MLSASVVTRSCRKWVHSILNPALSWRPSISSWVFVILAIALHVDVDASLWRWWRSYCLKFVVNPCSSMIFVSRLDKFVEGHSLMIDRRLVRLERDIDPSPEQRANC